MRKLKIGDKIVIKEGSLREIVKITGIENNPYNDIVPYSINTDLGTYIPTSAADGHWQESGCFSSYGIINPLASEGKGSV